MYKKSNINQLQLISEFKLPFGGNLNPNNRWVLLSQIIPWEKIEIKYSNNFSNFGPKAKNVRVAFGALLIKEKLALTDRETVEQISENPYLQFFIGLKQFETEKQVFDSSLMVYFRKRFDEKTIQEINEMIIDSENEDDDSDNDINNGAKETTSESDSKNKGTLIVDATCTPADIKYPTDVCLLNKAREKTEKIIDLLYASLPEMKTKPRTYRKKARKEYLSLAKQRKSKRQFVRKILRKQLGYLRRNISTIHKLLDKTGIQLLAFSMQKEFWVIQEVYRQQLEMYNSKKKSIDYRIVSISQPHIRPIVRGKKGSGTEFGAKVSISLVNGYSRVEKISWENFNEGVTLVEIIENYKVRYGYYPKRVLGDQLYRNRANKKYCKLRGINLSGPLLGRKSKSRKLEERKQLKKESGERNAVEGKFGEGKRKYGLGRIMSKLQETSLSVILLQFLVMNLEHKLRVLFLPILETLINMLQSPTKKLIKGAC